MLKPEKPKPHYSATRMCPHRHCRLAHFCIVASTLLFLCTGFTLGLPGLLFLMLLALITLPLAKAVYGGKSIEELAIENRKTRGTLITRPGWTRAAITGDLIAIALGIMDAYGDLRHPEPMQIPHPTATTLLKITVIVAGALFIPYAHVQATKPARTSRVPVPVGSES